MRLALHAGLYRRIDDEFRLQYAKLWQALIYGDPVAIKQHAEAMNAGDMYPLFVAMLTHVREPEDACVMR